MSTIRLLLGPQRPTQNLGAACDAAGLPAGTLAVISAGWQEAEGDIAELREVLGRPLEDLGLYQRAEAVFAADPGLADAHRARQDRLKEQQRLYRLRLGQLAVAARNVLKAAGDPDTLAAEQRHAISQLRALDRHHLRRTEVIHGSFDDDFLLDPIPELARQRGEVREILDRSSGVLITGGNIVVMLNRMRLLGVDELLGDKHVVAWSAGAMVLTQRIVLFHDRAPQGRRDPEVLGAGCGLLPGYVFFPDARLRLRERDRARMGLMCRRFSPDACVALDSGSALRFHDAVVAAAENVRRLNRDGRYARQRVA